MSNTRRRWEIESSDPILPWEKVHDEPRSGVPSQVIETEKAPVLYGPKGEPLTYRRPLGFRPPR